MPDQEIHKIFSVTNAGFEPLAFEIFRFQYRNNNVYRAYADMMHVDPEKVNSLPGIPFLPIQFFKTHAIKTTEFEPAVAFESSGTTQTVNSHHFVRDVELYKQSFLKGFELVYGPISEWCVL